MIKKIKEVEEYFLAQIMKGNYDVDSLDEYTLKIKIGSLKQKFQFVIWVANGVDCLRTYDEGNYMRVTFHDKEVREQIWSHVEKHIEDFYEANQRVKDEQELKRLTERLKK